MSPLERFEIRIERVTESGCWLWMGAAKQKSQFNYGNMWLNGRLQGVHRVSWQLFRGEIPVGAFVCHRCDVPLCANPAHLYLGTPMDNMRDMIAKGRDRRGHEIQSAKISKVSMADRAAIAESPLSFSTLAKMYGISRSGVQSIKRRWKEAA